MGHGLTLNLTVKILYTSELTKEEKLLASSLLLALDNDRSAKYRRECQSKNKEIDYTKINGLTHEELFSYFYETQKLSRKITAGNLNMTKKTILVTN